MKWGAEKVGQYSDKYGGSMGSALVGGALVALTITDIAAGAGLVGLAGKTLAKTIFTKGASQALLKSSLKSIPSTVQKFKSYSEIKSISTYVDITLGWFKSSKVILKLKEPWDRQERDVNGTI